MRQMGNNRPLEMPTAIDIKLVNDIIKHAPSIPQANYAYHNQGDYTFKNRASECGLGDPGFSNR